MTAQVRAILLAFAVALVWGPPVWADGPFPAQDVTPRFRFENLADYADLDFYLYYGHGIGDPYGRMFMTKVSPATTVALEGRGSVTPVVLLAVPHGQPAPRPNTNMEWFAKSNGGVLQSAPLDWSNGSITLYRVKVDQDRLQVTAAGSELLPLEWAAGNLCITLPAGLALSLACVLGGFWIVLRRRERNAVME